MLVMVDRLPLASDGTIRRGIQLDTLTWHADGWAGADVLILNTGHWWNLHKTIKTDIKEAFRQSLQTVKDWALTNPHDSPRAATSSFRSYSPSHYGNMTWDTGGSCTDQWDPLTMITSESDQQEHLWINTMISSVARSMRRWHGMNKEAFFLNIMYMTGLRRDGHPSRHREPETPSDVPEDFSHWCLSGVPDTWNQMMYGHLVSMGYDTRSIKR